MSEYHLRSDSGEINERTVIAGIALCVLLAAEAARARRPRIHPTRKRPSAAHLHRSTRAQPSQSMPRHGGIPREAARRRSTSPERRASRQHHSPLASRETARFIVDEKRAPRSVVAKGVDLTFQEKTVGINISYGNHVVDLRRKLAPSRKRSSQIASEPELQRPAKPFLLTVGQAAAANLRLDARPLGHLQAPGSANALADDGELRETMKRLAEGGRVVVFVAKRLGEEAETALSPVVPTAKFASLRTAIVGRSPETEPYREEDDSTFARAPSHGTENTEAGSRRSATSNTGATSGEGTAATSGAATSPSSSADDLR